MTSFTMEQLQARRGLAEARRARVEYILFNGLWDSRKEKNKMLNAYWGLETEVADLTIEILERQ